MMGFCICIYMYIQDLTIILWAWNEGDFLFRTDYLTSWFHSVWLCYWCVLSFEPQDDITSTLTFVKHHLDEGKRWWGPHKIFWSCSFWDDLMRVEGWRIDKTLIPGSYKINLYCYVKIFSDFVIFFKVFLCLIYLVKKPMKEWKWLYMDLIKISKWFQ